MAAPRSGAEGKAEGKVYNGFGVRESIKVESIKERKVKFIG